MRAWSVARKTLRETLREPQQALVVAFPVLLVSVYYLAFGAVRDEGLAGMLSLAVVDLDRGPAAAQLTERLARAQFDGKPVLSVRPETDRARAELAVRERKLPMLLVIPAGFSSALAAAAIDPRGAQAQAPVAAVELVGDDSSDYYVFTLAFVGGELRDFARAATGGRATIQLDYEYLPGTGRLSDFEAGVPGAIVFAMVLLVITTAMTMTREQTNGTLARLLLSRARAGDLLLGVTLAQLAVAAVQVPVTFGAALAYGFRAPLSALALAVGVGLLLSLAAVGLGLVTSCFARSEGEAAALGSMVLFPLVFLSGALFATPKVPLFTVGARTVQLWDVLPTTHASEALRKVMIHGQGVWQLGYELGALVLLCGLTLGAGVLLFQRLRLRAA